MPGASSISHARVLFAGRLEDQKGADLLPEILRRVKPPYPCDLVIYGSGRHESKLRDLSANPPPGWSVEVHYPEPNLSDKMPTFDLLIMPSRHEGHALLAIEAALLGIPVVATDAVGVRGRFPPGYPFLAETGDPTDSARTLQHALEEPAAWESVAGQSRDFARQHFTVDAMCVAYAELYRQAIDGHKPSRCRPPARPATSSFSRRS